MGCNFFKRIVFYTWSKIKLLLRLKSCPYSAGWVRNNTGKSWMKCSSGCISYFFLWWTYMKEISYNSVNYRSLENNAGNGTRRPKLVITYKIHVKIISKLLSLSIVDLTLTSFIMTHLNKNFSKLLINKIIILASSLFF